MLKALLDPKSRENRWLQDHKISLWWGVIGFAAMTQTALIVYIRNEAKK